MKKLQLITAISALLISTELMAQTTLIKNVNGYTVSGESLQQFSAILFSNDTIIKVYQTDATADVTPDMLIIDGEGKTMLPGLIDAHGHVLGYGHSLLQVDLAGTTSEADAVERTITYTKNNKALSWVLGRGWNQVQWANNTYPSAKSLDEAFPDKPVWLRRVDGHAGWANSKAMALAGITSASKSPAGGEIIKDKNGQLTGIFIDNAMDLITTSIAQPSAEEDKIALTRAMQSLASMGLTSVHDAGINQNNMNLYKELASENNMTIRINGMLYLPSPNWQQQLAQGPYKTSDEMFIFNSVKIQADGALGSRGASLISDYSDHAGHKGLLLHDNDTLQHYINFAMNAGFQVNTHAIGDNANKLILDLYQQGITKSKTKLLRHRIEHAQVLRLADIPRFSALNVIASMQTTHATSDKNMAVTRLGEQRIIGAYAWRKLLDSNVIIAAGSDFPVESPNPFYGLHAAITRQDHNNSPDGGWYADQKMTPIEALRSFTIDAAYSGHQDKIIGSLEAGKKADFILLSDDLFTMPASNIWQSQVLQTWVAGKKVYSLSDESKVN
ncbi:amidohydrolase [Colwellia psychrerythraea]|uniref:Amidohydrolase 3 n=1 Tax=Colwellia psychrerythraea TaxID=28229 RepID=A0A099KSF8_COLPS|nr:amidohydrolase [Colwellia psychrerythraea]KGJ92822.1 Amidohydrolase 3 [Colwellia psychrerythraea]